VQLEAVYTNLATRLADNHRPALVPTDPELRVDALGQRLDRLQEQEQKVRLLAQFRMNFDERAG
jgi:hypothetical protein